MPTDSPPERAAPRPDEPLVAVIGRHVATALGPAARGGLVRVRPLWGNHYRANVFQTSGPQDGRISHSYFLTADDDGAIVASSPDLTR